MLTLFADVTPLAAVFLGVGMAGVVSIPTLVFADAHRTDFPRLWQAAVHARHDVDWAVASALHLADDFVLDAQLTLRDAFKKAHRAPAHAAMTAAALLALLLPASPNGATR